MAKLDRHWLPQARVALFQQYATHGESVWVAACGTSMRPLIDAGTALLVEFGAVPAGPGDVIVFSHGDRLIAHRIVAWRQTEHSIQLIAKGDAEPYCDPPLQLVDVLGVVRACRIGRSYMTIGYVGRTARVCAYVSFWLRYVAYFLRRAAKPLPGHLGAIVLRAVPPLTHCAAEVLFAPLRWAGMLQARIQNYREGGDTYGAL